MSLEPAAAAVATRWTVGRLLAAGVGISVVALFLLATVSYRQIGSLAGDRESVERTYQVLNEISRLQQALEVAETSQRGYVITGRESFLTPYAEVLPKIAASQAVLKDLTRDDARQQQGVSELEQPVEDRLSALADVIEIRRTAGFQAAQTAVVSNSGLGDMTTIHGVLAGMHERASGLLERRLAQGAQEADQTRELIIYGSVIAGLLVGAAAFFITRTVAIPVQQVTATALRISAGDLSEAAPTSGPRELAQLAAAVQSIARSRDEALSATAAKSAFLATMSHEIRTPMNAVLGMTELLLDTELDASQREFTEIVRDSGDELLTLINDILDFSKIESGELELDDHPFFLRDCVEGALALVAVPASTKGLEVVVDLDGSCPELVRGDVTRLRQVLVNLLGNAVKFTEHGEIVVRATGRQLSDRPGGLLLLSVEVSDTGIGIPADRMHRLFHSFSQVDSSTTRVYGGTGLGLAISRRLAQAMGGDLQVTSAVGVGSRFTLTAVLAGALDQRQPGLVEAQLLSGRSALVVDDNDTNCRVLRLQLQGWGMTCTAVQSPAEALELLASGRTFDVAVLDFHMPGMDGGELASRLRQLPGGRDLPLILLTSLHGGLEPEQRALFAATLTKPARKSVLQDRLLKVLSPLSDGHVPLTTAGRRADDGPKVLDQPLRVLLAEDNPINQKVAQLLLSKLGHHVDTVNNGLEAVEATRHAAYDVVLMDVQMPELDGLQATQRIRAALPAPRQPWIVALTASVLIEDRAACSRAGMDAYLPKPVRRRDLNAVLAPLQRALLAKAEPGPGFPDQPSASTPSDMPSALVDTGDRTARETAVRDHLVELRGPQPYEDDELLIQLLRFFVRDAPESVDLLHQAIKTDDAKRVEFLAHRLKGSAYNLGADALGDLCHALETSARSTSLTSADQLLERARHELAAVSEVMTVVAGEFDGAALTV